MEKEIKNSPSYEKREIILVKVTPAELGLPKGGTLEQIYEAAEKKASKSVRLKQVRKSASSISTHPIGTNSEPKISL